MAKNDAKRKSGSDAARHSGCEKSSASKVCQQPTSDRSAKVIEIWREEVATLSNRSFPSLSDAVECVIEQVGKRMNASKDECDFLRVLIGTDPELCAQMQERIQIRGT